MSHNLVSAGFASVCANCFKQSWGHDIPTLDPPSNPFGFTGIEHLSDFFFFFFWKTLVFKDLCIIKKKVYCVEFWYLYWTTS